MTRAFERQADVVNVRPWVTLHNVNFDNGDGQLNYPTVDNSNEFNSILNDNGVKAVQANYKLFFINAVAPSPVLLLLPGGTAETLGYSLANVHASAVSTRDRLNFANPFSADKITTIAAHELGHLLGLDHYKPNQLNNHLMVENYSNNPNNFWELDKAEWDIINP